MLLRYFVPAGTMGKGLRVTRWKTPGMGARASRRRVKASSENPELCVTLPRQNAHLPLNVRANPCVRSFGQTRGSAPTLLLSRSQALISGFSELAMYLNKSGATFKLICNAEEYIDQGRIKMSSRTIRNDLHRFFMFERLFVRSF